MNIRQKILLGMGMLGLTAAGCTLSYIAGKIEGGFQERIKTVITIEDKMENEGKLILKYGETDLDYKIVCNEGEEENCMRHFWRYRALKDLKKEIEPKWALSNPFPKRLEKWKKAKEEYKEKN